MKSKEKEFERWYDEYFGNSQGEDSPYTYNDVRFAFKMGWNACLTEKTREE